MARPRRSRVPGARRAGSHLRAINALLRSSNVPSCGGSVRTQAATNLPTGMPWEFGNRLWDNVGAPTFQAYGSLASALPSAAGDPVASSGLIAAADDGFAAPLDPQISSPLAEIVPLTDAEERDMLDELFRQEQRCQSVENGLPRLPQHQLYPPYHMEAPVQTANNDPSRHSITTQSPLPSGMANSSAGETQSLPFGHHQQSSSRQVLPTLDGGWQQLVDSAAFLPSRTRESGAMEYPIGAPSPSNSNVVSALVQDTHEGDLAMNSTPSNAPVQPAADISFPSKPQIPVGHSNSRSANQAIPATRILPGEQGRGRRNRLPRRRTAPATDAGMSVSATENFVEVTLGRIDASMEAQRQNHVQAERRKRQHMNEMYDIMRSLLPLVPGETRPSNTAVITGMIEYISRCQEELEMLEVQLKRSRQPVATLRNGNPLLQHADTTATPLLRSRGYTCVDHTSDPSALTAVTTLPAEGSHSGLASFLGTNVAIICCHNNYTLAVSSPYMGCALALLEQMLITINDHHLEVLFISISTAGPTHIYSLQCQARPGAELPCNDLHSVLQSIVNNFPASSSS